jgi:hypothetical protein
MAKSKGRTQQKKRTRKANASARSAGSKNFSPKKPSIRRRWRDLKLRTKAATLSGVIVSLSGVIGAIALVAWPTVTSIIPPETIKDKGRGIIQPALSVNIDHIGNVSGEGVEWVFPYPKSLTQSQTRGMNYALYGARQDGAYMLGDGFINLRITSHRHQQIIITDVAAVDVASIAPAHGTLVHTNGAGEVLSSLLIRFNQPSPIVEAHKLRGTDFRGDLSSPGLDGGLYLAHPEIALKSEDTAAITIGVSSLKRAISFRIRISYAIGGGEQGYVVAGTDSRRNGPPFRVSARCGKDLPFHYSDGYYWDDPKTDGVGFLRPMPQIMLDRIQYGCSSTPPAK